MTKVYGRRGAADDRELGDTDDAEHDGSEPDLDVCDPVERGEGCQRASQVSDWDAVQITGRRVRPRTDLFVADTAGASVERLRVLLVKLRGRDSGLSFQGGAV